MLIYFYVVAVAIQFITKVKKGLIRRGIAHFNISRKNRLYTPIAVESTVVQNGGKNGLPTERITQLSADTPAKIFALFPAIHNFGCNFKVIIKIQLIGRIIAV